MTKISAVIPEELGAALKECAHVEDRSVGAVVRRAIAEHVRRPERPSEGQATDLPAEPVRDEKEAR